MAHVQKRNGRWQARYRDPAGKEHAKRFDRKVDAQKWLDKNAGAMAGGTYVDPQLGRQTFEEWTAAYFAGADKRATTMARDRTVTRRHFLPALGRLPLAAITPLDVCRIVDAMAEHLAPATVRTNYGVLRAILNAAVDAELIARSPARGVRLPTAARKTIRFLDVDELGRLVEAIAPEYRPAVLLAGVLGLRWSEVAGLRVGRINFLRRTLEVVETVAEVEGHLIYAEPKTAASRRTLRMPTFVLDALAEHLRQTGRTEPSELVLQAPGGGPMRAGNFRTRVWAPAVEAAGLPGLTFHGLRHSAAGLMIEVGAHIEAIKQRMGHSSIRVTSDVYGSLLPSVDESVSRHLDDLLARSCGQTADRAAGERSPD